MSDEEGEKDLLILSTQGDIAGNRQEQYPSLVKNKRKPDVVIKLLHYASQNTTDSQPYSITIAV
jgi:hypothetical protein